MSEPANPDRYRYPVIGIALESCRLGKTPMNASLKQIFSSLRDRPKIVLDLTYFVVRITAICGSFQYANLRQ